MDFKWMWLPLLVESLNQSKKSEKPAFLSVPETDVDTRAPTSESDSVSPSIILTQFSDTSTNMVKKAITEIQ